MTGWLVVNGFLASAKFDDLYVLLVTAFAARGIALVRLPNTSFTAPLGAPLAPPGVPPDPDFVLFWDKDVLLARRLAAAGLPLFNSPDAIAVCDDKALTLLALARAGVRTPRTIPGPFTFDGVPGVDEAGVRAAVATLGLPCVFKEAHGSFGQQVHLVTSVDAALARVRAAGSRPWLLQEYIAASSGRDLRINVVGDRVVATLLRTNLSDFRSNITRGGAAKAYTPDPAQAAAALAAARAVGTDFAGVDVLFGSDGAPYVCEVNSNPHFRSTLDATGINLADAIAAHVCARLAAG